MKKKPLLVVVISIIAAAAGVVAAVLTISKRCCKKKKKNSSIEVPLEETGDETPHDEEPCCDGPDCSCGEYDFDSEMEDEYAAPAAGGAKPAQDVQEDPPIAEEEILQTEAENELEQDAGEIDELDKKA